MKSSDEKKLELLYEEIYNEGIRSSLAQIGSNIGKMFAGDQSAALDKTYKIFRDRVLKSIKKMEQSIANSPGELPPEENSPVLLDLYKVTKWLKPFLENPVLAGEWTYNKALNPSSTSAAPKVSVSPEASKKDLAPSTMTSEPPVESPGGLPEETKPSEETKTIASDPHALSQSQIEKAKMELDAIKKFTRKIAKTPEIKDLISKAQKALEIAKKQNERSKAKSSKQKQPLMTPSPSSQTSPSVSASPTAGTVVAGEGSKK